MLCHRSSVCCRFNLFNHFAWETGTICFLVSNEYIGCVPFIFSKYGLMIWGIKGYWRVLILYIFFSISCLWNDFNDEINLWHFKKFTFRLVWIKNSLYVTNSISSLTKSPIRYILFRFSLDCPTFWNSIVLIVPQKFRLNLIVKTITEFQKVGQSGQKKIIGSHLFDSQFQISILMK